MKKNLIMSIIMLCIVLTLAACDSTNSKVTGSDNESSVETPYTLFNSKERSIWYWVITSEDFGKDNRPNAFLIFENGKVTYYENASVHGNTGITFGEVAKMSDDDLYEAIIENSNQSIKTIGAEEIVLHTYTDKSGNNVEYEELLFTIPYKDGSGIGEGSIKMLNYPMSQALQIYDTNFAGFPSKTNTYSDSYTGYFLTKVNVSFSFSLDEIGKNDIPVD